METGGFLPKKEISRKGNKLWTRKDNGVKVKRIGKIFFFFPFLEISFSGFPFLEGDLPPF